MTTTKLLLWTAFVLLPMAQGRLSGQSHRITQEDEMINVVVGYSTEENSTFQAHQGRRYLSQLHVLSQFKRANAISMKIRSSELYKLYQDPDVIYVEEDIKMYPLNGGFRNNKKNKNKNKNNKNNKNKNEDTPNKSKDNKDSVPSKNTSSNSRNTEDTPWGVRSVYGGNVDEIPKPDPNNGCFKICVVDTGLSNHPDIPFARGDGKLRGRSFNLPPGQEWFNPSPSANHGTHVTGTIIASGENGIGVEGVISNSDNFCMMHARVFGDDISKGQYVSQIDMAVEWCADGGAKVINLSLGFTQDLRASQEIYAQLEREGVLVVSAAGNAGNDSYEYPASYSTVISVASVDRDLSWSEFSNYNNQVDITAPGKDILSTVTSYGSGAYSTKSGTSMASPHVAGAAALIWASKPGCTASQVRRALLETALDLGRQGRDNYYGNGLVQAVPAYRYLDNLGC